MIGKILPPSLQDFLQVEDQISGCYVLCILSLIRVLDNFRDWSSPVELILYISCDIAFRPFFGSVRFAYTENTMFSAIILITVASWTPHVQARNETLLHGWKSEPRGRGTWSILWSCLATIFICTWSSQHLDVPVRRGKWYRQLLRKIGWMLVAFMAPEIPLFNAAENFLKSRSAAEKLKKQGKSEWTLTHAQFAFANGFRTRKPQSDLETEDLCNLYRLQQLIVEDGKKVLQYQKMSWRVVGRAIGSSSLSLCFKSPGLWYRHSSGPSRAIRPRHLKSWLSHSFSARFLSMLVLWINHKASSILLSWKLAVIRRSQTKICNNLSSSLWI